MRILYSPGLNALSSYLSNRSRVCHLTSLHCFHLWFHQRSPGAHFARVSRFLLFYRLVSHDSHHLAPLLLFHSLQVNYAQDSFTWDFMAKRELDAPGAGEELQTAKGRASDINRREERCCQVYEEGVGTVNTGGCNGFSNGRICLVFTKSLLNFAWRDGFNADLCELGVSEPMWMCYVAFCLERLKRKTNVQELKDQVWEELLQSECN